MTRCNSSEKVLDYSLVKCSMGFLIASCAFGQAGKWFKLGFGIFGPYPMSHFIFLSASFHSSLVLLVSSWAVQVFTLRHPSRPDLSGQRPMYQTFPSQYVLVCTPLPKGFAHWFSIHMVSKSVLECFICASLQV